jgi:outer membrane protein TolC
VTLSALLGADIIAGVASEQLLTPARGRQARVAATQARIDARLTDLDAIERALASRVRIIAAERIASERRREAALDARAANRANLVESRALYEIGRQSLLALLDAEREALEAERQLIRAEHDTAVIGYRALAATGDILDLFGIDVSAQDPRDAVQ